MTRVRLWILEADPIKVLSSPDAFIIRNHPGMTVNVILSGISDSIVVKGAYERGSRDRYLRRITGGPSIQVDGNGMYIAVIMKYQWSLKTLLSDVSKLFKCISKSDIRGGRGGDGSILGVTKVAGMGIAEILSNRHIEYAYIEDCIGRNLGRITRREKLDQDLIPIQAINRNRDPTWIRRPRPYNISSYIHNNKGYIIGFTGWLEDEVIHWIEIDGSFYASPPSQVYALVDTVVQTPPSPGLVYEFTAAWSTFVDTAGITIDDLSIAFQNLVKEAESKLLADR